MYNYPTRITNYLYILKVPDEDLFCEVSSRSLEESGEDPRADKRPRARSYGGLVNNYL